MVGGERRGRRDGRASGLARCGRVSLGGKMGRRELGSERRIFGTIHLDVWLDRRGQLVGSRRGFRLGPMLC